MKNFLLLRLIVVICVLGLVSPKPANSEAKNSDTQNGNEPGVKKHFDFSDFLGNIFGGQPGSQSFFPNTQTGNGQMNGQQQQYPNQQNNQNQWQNRPSGNNFQYPNQGNNNGGGRGGGAFNNNNIQNPWHNSGMQQYPNNAGSGQNNNQLPNQGQGQSSNSSGNTNNLDWKNLYPSLTLNQPPSQINNNPQTQNPQFNSQLCTSTTTDMTPILCQQNCPNTAEYNPVCGDNNVTYNNPGSLLCARNCGLTVRLNHRGRCSGQPANRFLG